MAALTAAFANPPASKPTETAIAHCDDCEPAALPTLTVLAPATPETRPLVPASLKEEICADTVPCATGRETAPPQPHLAPAAPS